MFQDAPISHMYAICILVAFYTGNPPGVPGTMIVQGVEGFEGKMYQVPWYQQLLKP